MERLVYSGRREWVDIRVNQAGEMKAARMSGCLDNLDFCGTDISICMVGRSAMLRQFKSQVFPAG